MKIAHSDGGDFVLTADLREASYIAYLILAYGEQAAEMLQSANAATPPESPTSEGSANV